MNDQNPHPPNVHCVKLIARASLGLVWIYEGLVPKIFFVHSLPEQAELVRRSHIWWGSPEITLIVLGVAQIIAGLALISGWRERATALITTIGLVALIALVAYGRPAMLTDPFGALAKDACLIACAAIVWMLSPSARLRRDSSRP